jgi:hypothetical protein
MRMREGDGREGKEGVRDAQFHDRSKVRLRQESEVDDIQIDVDVEPQLVEAGLEIRVGASEHIVH